MKPKPPKDLWTQLSNIVGAPVEEMEGISVSEFAERYKLGISAARKRLEALAKEGKLIKGLRRWRYGWTAVYRPKD